MHFGYSLSGTFNGTIALHSCWVRSKPAATLLRPHLWQRRNLLFQIHTWFWRMLIFRRHPIGRNLTLISYLQITPVVLALLRKCVSAVLLRVNILFTFSCTPHRQSLSSRSNGNKGESAPRKLSWNVLLKFDQTDHSIWELYGRENQCT